MATLRIVTVVWFSASVVISVGSQLALYIWLRRQGAQPRSGLAGMPGYLDGVYREWCEGHGRSARRVLLLRRLSYVNLALAIVPAVFGLAG